MSATDYAKYNHDIDKILAALEPDVSGEAGLLDGLQADLDGLANRFRDDEHLGSDRYKMYQAQAMIHFRKNNHTKALEWIQEAVKIRGASYPFAEELIRHLRVEQPPLFFAIPVSRLVILSLLTLGIYPVYWFYKNWSFVRDSQNEKIYPVLRAFFSIFFCYSLFQRVLDAARQQDYHDEYSPGLLATVYIILSILAQTNSRGTGSVSVLLDVIGVVGLFAFVPLIPVQKAINYHNQRVDPNFDPEPKFYRGEIIMTAVGCSITGLFLLLLFIAAFSR